MIFHIVVKKIRDEDTVKYVKCVETVKKEDDTVYFGIPISLQLSIHHKQLFELPIIKNATKTLTKIGQYRNISITLNDDLKRTYMDEEGNLVFEETYLDEVKIPSEGNSGEVNKELSPSVKTKEDLNGIEKKFSIDNFDKMGNAKDWLSDFEGECERLDIISDESKIKCLKLFLKDSAQVWYRSNIIKLEDNDWQSWKTSFLTVFNEKGWSNVRYAISFKYMSGSLTDYALKKENLLLEMERTMSEKSKISLIVVGLPIYIQDKLDRESISSTDELINAIGAYEGQVSRKTEENYGEKSKGKKNPKDDIERKPCTICKSLNFPGRFHPVEQCRNKDSPARKFKVNLNEKEDSNQEDFMKLQLDSKN